MRNRKKKSHDLFMKEGTRNIISGGFSVSIQVVRYKVSFFIFTFAEYARFMKAWRVLMQLKQWNSR